MTGYDIFIIVMLCITLPLVAMLAVFVWISVVALIIDFIKYGW